jgi:hypothetical protein
MPPQQRHTRKRSRNGLQHVDVAWTYITETAKKLKFSQELTKGQNNRVQRVTEGRTNQKHTSAALKYYAFLNAVLEISPIYHLLLMATFSQNQIDATKASVLNDLIEKIKEGGDDASILSPGLRSLTARLEERRTVQPLSEHTPGLPSASDYFEYTHAELEGTRSVFGEAMVRSIKDLPIEQNWRAVTKAVTMRFPKSPLPEDQSCSLQLDICEEYVKELGMMLCNIEVHWMTDTFHVVHDNGMVGIVRYFQYEHKGASAEAVGRVFGTEIMSAINECPVRHKELAEGKSTTQCVSMIFVRSGGTIEMSLGLEIGVQIQTKLWMKNIA